MLKIASPLLTASLVSLALVLAGCSDDDESSNDGTMASGGTDNSSAELNLLETAEAAGDFSTLVAAVEAAGLTDTLNGDGPFTVFAPTDDAFAALPDGTVDTLLMPENQDQLIAVLTYHVVSGAVPAETVVTLDSAETVNGASVGISVEGDSVALTDGQDGTANVVMTDIEASNGVIHVIDAVLLPPAE
jgi:uncharacterized surface protein with fasciclin (FAS1) repeats